LLSPSDQQRILAHALMTSVEALLTRVPDLGQFEQESRAFIEAKLPELRWPTVPAEARPDRRLFGGGPNEDLLMPVARRWRAAKFDAGFGWLTGPVEYGGAGLPPEYERLFSEIENEYDVPGEDIFWFGVESVAPALLAHGSNELKSELLGRIFRGDCIVCQLYSEPDAGSDLASLSTKAARVPSGWIVNGQKTWSSGAQRASMGLLLCRTGAAEDRHRGITAFMVDMDAVGVDVRPLREMDGGTEFNEVFLTDVHIPDNRRVGDVGAGWPVAMGVQANARSKLAHRRRGKDGGLATVASSERLATVMQRLDLADSGMLRQSWARLHTSYVIADLLNRRLEASPNVPRSISAASGALAKLALTNALSQAADLLYAVLGPRIGADTGTEDSFEWLPYVLQVPGYHIGGGTREILKNVVAERGLELPRDRGRG
jgi:alkylation response protein AidB-like acyl-CoA dehydrogenase